MTTGKPKQESYIGARVVLVVYRPPGHRYCGNVSYIDAHSSVRTITLVEIEELSTGEKIATRTFQASNIKDILRPPDESTSPVEAPTTTAPATGCRKIPSQSSLPFVDPAIISLSVKYTSCGPSSLPCEQENGDSAHAVHSNNELPSEASGIPSQQGASLVKHITPTKTIMTPGAALGPAPHVTKSGTRDSAASTHFIQLHQGQRQLSGAQPHGMAPLTEHTSRRRRGGQNKRQKNGVAGNNTTPARKQHGDNGWRKTPILQNAPTFQASKVVRRLDSGQYRSDDWMSEDATDGQGKGDFDFNPNSSKVNKHGSVVEFRRQGPTMTPRLSQSRHKHGGGRPGSKDMVGSEHLLHRASLAVGSSATGLRPDYWNSEAESGSQLEAPDVGNRAEPGSGQSSRRGESKGSNARRPQPRKLSTHTVTLHPPSRVNSGMRFDTPQVGEFFLSESGKAVDAISPLQMLNLENIAINEIGLRADILTENIARGITDVALIALKEPALKLRRSTVVGLEAALEAGPAVVVLAGNNKSGARAVATARHLRNKNIKLLLCVVGIDHVAGANGGLIDEVRDQVRIFQNLGGRVHGSTGMFEQLRAAAGGSGVQVIVDGLLGLSVSFEELRTSDQAATYELMQWANRNEAFVLAIDVPAGVDPGTGAVSSISGEKLYVRPRYVAILGAPKSGVLATLNDGGDAAQDLVAGPDDWRLYLVDMGLGAAVWRKSGIKMRRGIDMGDKWVQPMKLKRLD